MDSNQHICNDATGKELTNVPGLVRMTKIMGDFTGAQVSRLKMVLRYGSIQWDGAEVLHTCHQLA